MIKLRVEYKNGNILIFKAVKGCWAVDLRENKLYYQDYDSRAYNVIKLDNVESVEEEE